MRKNKNSNKYRKNKRGRSRGFLPAFLIAVFGIGGILGWLHFNASLTHLRFAEVYIEDLPAQFENTGILFVSDLNIRNAGDAAACKRAFEKLKDVNADIMILGGDYRANTLMSTINGDNSAQNNEYALGFIESLKNFYTPLGKFAVSGENDNTVIEEALNAAGVQHLADACAVVEKNGDQLVIAGLNDASRGRTPYEEIGAHFDGSECVIAVAHNPSAYVGIRVAEAKNGGAWADLVLSGHTLGGQIKVFDRTLRSMPEEETRCLAGWHYTDDLPMLVSQGLGCKDVKLRLGTQSEIWYITLHKPQTAGSILPKL